MLNSFQEKIRLYMNQGIIPEQEEFQEGAEKELLHGLQSLGFLKELLERERLCEVSIFNENDIYISCLGEKQKKTEMKLPKALYSLYWEYLAWIAQVNWNSSHPFCSFEYTLHSTQLRITMIHASLTPNKKEKIYLRVLNTRPLKLVDFDLSRRQEEKIQELIQDKKNIIVCGETGSGKTSFLNSLLDLIPKHEHVVIMEDLNEICTHNPLHTKLVAQGHKSEEQLKDFCHYALRMSPDRMVLGEIRSHEVVPFLLSMNTGHKGLMGTLHANNAAEAISRLALLFNLYGNVKDISFHTVMDLICQNLDYVVFLKDKKVLEITHIYGQENGHVRYEKLELIA